MKKVKSLLVLLLFSVIFSNLFAQKDRTLSNGLCVSLVTGFPSASFGTTDNASSGSKYGSLFGVQVGNRWYIKPQDKYGFGLMVNWIDFVLAGKVGKESGLNKGNATIDLTLLEFGPVGTYAITDKIAFDAYYNFRPTVLVSALIYSDPTGKVEDETYTYSGFGFSHTLGGAFRWKMLNLGIEYVVGGINCKGTYNGALPNVTLQDSKNKTNSLRIILGVKL